VRRVLLVAVTMAAGPVLLSCSEPRLSASESPTNSPLAYEPPGPVTRAPLLPPAGYAAPSPSINSPTSSGSKENAERQTVAQGGWHASRRWAAVKGEGCIMVDRFEEAAQAEAAKVRIENCSKEDINSTPVQ
jgi:hypothetical protein